MSLRLDNDTKIKFCNAFDAMLVHKAACRRCDEYLKLGDGDLCEQGKAIIAENLAYAATRVDLKALDTPEGQTT